MDMFGECSYNDDHYDDEVKTSISEVKECIKGPSFETLTAADIITLMNAYIEEVKIIVEVSLIVGLFFYFLFNKNKIFIFYCQMVYM